MKLFLSPHNDDLALFGAYTVATVHPICITVFDSFRQADRSPGFHSTAQQRRAEDIAAHAFLDPAGPALRFFGLDDREEATNALELLFANLISCEQMGEDDQVWIPEPEEGGNAHHNLIGHVGHRHFTAAGVKVTRYTTYTTRGRSRWGDPVPFTGEMVRRKLLALACYRSQINRADQVEHFTRGLDEFYVPEGAPLWES